jgi:hypothetical protein
MYTATLRSPAHSIVARPLIRREGGQVKGGGASDHDADYLKPRSVQEWKREVPGWTSLLPVTLMLTT